MSAKANNLRIGIFMLVAVFLFIAGLLAFGAKSYFATKLTYETAIEGEVTGLAVGSKVLLRGVPIGKVSNIDFAMNLYPSSTSRMIVVEFEVDRSIFKKDQTPEARDRHREEEIARGMRAMVKAQGITGTSILTVERLNPRENPPPEIDYTPRHPYVPSAPGQFTRMLESIEQSLRNIQRLDLPGLGIGASNTLAEAKNFLEKLNRLDLESTMGKADATLDQAKTTVANIDTTIKNMKLDRLGSSADELLAQLKDSNARLQTVLDHASDMPLKDTLEDLRGAVHTLDGVLLDLKRYPSGFIFGKPPLAAKSVEAPDR